MLLNRQQDRLPFGRSSYGGAYNAAFYTTDGMRFEIPGKSGGSIAKTFKSHETGEIIYFSSGYNGNNYHEYYDGSSSGCDSKGLGIGGYKDSYPCLIMVDVNGDRKPNPANATGTNTYQWAAPGDKLFKDIFTIMITEDKAIPLGVVAQKAMYQSRR